MFYLDVWALLTKILIIYFSILKIMIISKQRDLEEIIKCLESGKVFLVGCSQCATICKTGGEKEIIRMKESLEKKRIKVTGWVVLDPACHYHNDIRMLKNYKNDLEKSDKVLVLSCGNGVQTVSKILPHIDTIPGADTLFLGEIEHYDEFNRNCNMCGSCLLDFFDGFCPISRCPKKMLNGPCGGSLDGKCEIDKDAVCVWDEIINRFKEKNKLNDLKMIIKPKDWSNSIEMRRHL